jgi:hypothetical protein
MLEQEGCLIPAVRQITLGYSLLQLSLKTKFLMLPQVGF